MTALPKRLSMKTQTGKNPRDWFRIENLHKDDAQSSDEKAVIYIYDEIGDSWWGDSTSANDFIREVSGLSVNEIELHVNSPGGDIFDGIAIYQALKAHPAEVTVYVDALAASAASFIAQAGDKVIMTQAATMMIHDGSSMVWGNASDMRSTADLLDKLSNTVAGIYASRAGKTEKFWRNLMIDETWYNAQEAVDAGLADEVGGDTAKEDQAVSNKWDLSIFNQATGPMPSLLQARTRIANQFSKEKAVKPGNSNTPPEPEQPGTGSPDTDPDAQTTGDPAPAVEPVEPETPPVTPAAPAATPAADPAPPANLGVQRFTFQLAGTQVSMSVAEMATQLDTLQTSQNEAKLAGKKAFVKQLHDDKKITGPQVKATEKFALGLSDEQYDDWKATFEGASSIPMLATQVDGTTNHTGSGASPADATAAEIDKCKAIVKNFKDSNMKDDAIKGTASYKRLVELDPTFKL